MDVNCNLSILPFTYLHHRLHKACTEGEHEYFECHDMKLNREQRMGETENGSNHGENDASKVMPTRAPTPLPQNQRKRQKKTLIEWFTVGII